MLKASGNLRRRDSTTSESHQGDVWEKWTACLDHVGSECMYGRSERHIEPDEEGNTFLPTSRGHCKHQSGESNDNDRWTTRFYHSFTVLAMLARFLRVETFGHRGL